MTMRADFHPEGAVSARAGVYERDPGSGWLTLALSGETIILHEQTPETLFALSDAIFGAGTEMQREMAQRTKDETVVLEAPF